MVELKRLLAEMGIAVNVVAPFDATPADLARLPDAAFNVVLYPEVAAQAAGWLQRQFGMPMTKTVPIGAAATREFVAEVARLQAAEGYVYLKP